MNEFFKTRYIHTMEYYLTFKKEGNPVIGNSIGEFGGNYAK